MQDDRSNNTDGKEGFWLIDKPYLWTSFGVIKKMRKVLNEKKIGHAGTLDPLATGLLILCSGKRTKSIQNYVSLPKKYTGQIYFGASTKSYDLETQAEPVSSLKNITEEKILNCMQSFTGKIQQTPPSFSAIKVKGKRSYDLARQGLDFKLKQREVSIYHFTMVQWLKPILFFSLECSSGTYVRSLAKDMGEKLGCGAYLYSLRREKIGHFDVLDAITMSSVNCKLEQ